MIKTILYSAFAALLLSSGSLFALPADIEADRLVLAAEEKIAQQDFESAKGYLQRVTPLKVEPKPTYHFLYGQVMLHEGSLEKAGEQLTEYVQKVGREGEHYDAALRMLTQIEEQLQSRQDVSDSRGSADLKAAGIESGDTEGQAYDERVRRLYLSGTLKDSLVLHVNSLLRSHQYLEGKVKNAATSPRENYSLSVNAPSEILVSKTVHNNPAANGQAEISISRINAFGVSPYVSYRCSKPVDSCVIQNPVNGEDWIRVAHNEDGARELSTALTRLIKALQR